MHEQRRREGSSLWADAFDHVFAMQRREPHLVFLKTSGSIS